LINLQKDLSVLGGIDEKQRRQYKDGVVTRKYESTDLCLSAGNELHKVGVRDHNLHGNGESKHEHHQVVQVLIGKENHEEHHRRLNCTRQHKEELSSIFISQWRE
jgi:hypothetical protein